MLKRNRTNLGVAAEEKMLPSIRELIQMGTTFLLTVLAWVFFRAENIMHARAYLSKIFSKTLFEIPEFQGEKKAIEITLLILAFVLMEWNSRENKHTLANSGVNWKRPLRHLFYFILLILIFWYDNVEQEFIYFQF